MNKQINNNAYETQPQVTLFAESYKMEDTMDYTTFRHSP